MFKLIVLSIVHRTILSKNSAVFVVVLFIIAGMMGCGSDGVNEAKFRSTIESKIIEINDPLTLNFLVLEVDSDLNANEVKVEVVSTGIVVDKSLSATTVAIENGYQVKVPLRTSKVQLPVSDEVKLDLCVENGKCDRYAVFVELVVGTSEPQTPPKEEVPPTEQEIMVGYNASLSNLAANTAMWIDYFACPSHGPTENDTRCSRSIHHNKLFYVSSINQIAMFSGGGSSSSHNDVLLFDTSTLTWQSSYLRTSCDEMVFDQYDPNVGRWLASNLPLSRYINDLAVYDGQTDSLIIFANKSYTQWCADSFFEQEHTHNGIIQYHFSDAQWQFHQTENNLEGNETSELDPVSGHLLVVGQHDYTVYDASNLAVIRQEAHSHNFKLSYNKSLIYYPPTDKFYHFYSAGVVYEVMLDRETYRLSYTQLDMSGDIPTNSPKSLAYDSKNEIIGGVLDDGLFYVFDPLLATWTTHKIALDPLSLPSIVNAAVHMNVVFDPVNNVFFYLSQYAGDDEHTGLWAYRYR